MNFEPRLSTTQGLDHLATRLGPIIQDRLSQHLAGHRWPVVLEQLDVIAGRKSRKYSEFDLQAQLKMLTRRLGALGYPLDDDRQTAGTLGRELTIVRNARAHGDPFTALDAWRANDYCVRLLDYFSDSKGVAQAEDLRRQALEAYVEEEGLSPKPLRSDPPRQGPMDVDEGVTLDHSVYALARPPRASLVGEERLTFDPWVPVAVGDPEILDDFRRRAAREKVRAVAAEIVEAEGPISLERLGHLIASAFGSQNRKKRAGRIWRQVRATQHVDNHGFVWPEGIDPAIWVEFRPSGNGIGRPFADVSPIEIANSITFLWSREPELSGYDLQAATLRIFGRARSSRDSRKHYATALELAEKRKSA